MSKQNQAEAIEPKEDSRSDRRREKILDAFHDCIIAKGYSQMTLRDISEAAGMSASHVLYYFSGKDAILVHYFNSVAQRIRKRIDSFRNKSPAEQVDLLAGLFFAGKGISKSETGFMLECFGVAVHDRHLHTEKADLDRFCKDYLENLFSQVPSTKARARDHAEVAYAMLIGMRTAAFFDEDLSLAHARHLFYQSVLSQAGCESS